MTRERLKSELGLQKHLNQLLDAENKLMVERIEHLISQQDRIVAILNGTGIEVITKEMKERKEIDEL